MVRKLFVILLSGQLFAVTSYPSMKEFYHPVSTESVEAQEAFNKGLIAIYAFNYDEALVNFQQAAACDPKLAMAYWGIAYAYEEAEKNDQSKPYIEKAQELKGNASQAEQDYIEALSARFPKKRDVNKHESYRDAMKRLHQKYPDDPDAAVLYAESMMNLLNWHLWNDNLEPKAPYVSDILAVLEETIKKTPLHPGADHFYIHAIEGSKFPERGIPAAQYLQIFTDWGHLLHSSSHIYLRTGDYEKAVEANLAAIAADEKYLKAAKVAYAVKYVTHSFFYLYKSYLWQEKEEESKKAANDLVEFVTPHLTDQPNLEENLLTPIEVLLYFHLWDEILNYPEPGEECKLTRAFYHFARSLAFLGKNEIKEAHVEEKAFLTLKEEAPKNNALEMSELELKAAFIKSEGTCDQYFDAMKKVIAKEDEGGVLEWYHQSRQTYGAALIEAGRAPEAEVVFRESLQDLPRNGRSLFGLAEALKAQKKDAYWVEREAKEALKSKSINLKAL